MIVGPRIRQSLAANLVLWVFEKNARARSFYEAVGYRLESERQKQRRFAGATAMELRYRKLLDETATIGDTTVILPPKA